MANYVTYIDGKPYFARLPFDNGEWDDLIHLFTAIGAPFDTDNSRAEKTLCQNRPRTGTNKKNRRFVRGGAIDQREQETVNADSREPDIGYRPVLIPLIPGMYIHNRNPWPDELIGTTWDMGALAVNRSVVDTSNGYRTLPGDKLSLVDTPLYKYAAIRWIRAKDILVASRVLATSVSWNDLQAADLIPDIEPPKNTPTDAPANRRILPTENGCLVLTGAESDRTYTLRFVSNQSPDVKTLISLQEQPDGWTTI